MALDMAMLQQQMAVMCGGQAPSQTEIIQRPYPAVQPAPPINVDPRDQDIPFESRTTDNVNTQLMYDAPAAVTTLYVQFDDGVIVGQIFAVG